MGITLEEHYNLFVAECQRLHKEWGLNDWKIYFEHRENEGNRAQIWWNIPNHVATIQLATDWGESEVTDQGIISAARHEMINLLCAPTLYIAECRYCTESELAAERERLSRHLHSIIFQSDLFEVEKCNTEVI